MDTAEVHLLCNGRLQGEPLTALVVKRGLLSSNYSQLPRTTYATHVSLYPTWIRTASMIRSSCKKGKCKSGRTYPHGHSSNPFHLGKIFLEGTGQFVSIILRSHKKTSENIRSGRFLLYSNEDNDLLMSRRTLRDFFIGGSSSEYVKKEGNLIEWKYSY